MERAVLSYNKINPFSYSKCKVAPSYFSRNFLHLNIAIASSIILIFYDFILKSSPFIYIIRINSTFRCCLRFFVFRTNVEDKFWFIVFSWLFLIFLKMRSYLLKVLGLGEAIGKCLHCIINSNHIGVRSWIKAQ